MPVIEYLAKTFSPARGSRSTGARSPSTTRRPTRPRSPIPGREPTVLRALIDSNIRALIDPELWRERIEFQRDGQATLNAFSRHYDEIHRFLVDEGLLEDADADDNDV